MNWYRSKSKGARVFICVILVGIFIFANIRSNRFILSQFNNDTPENAIRCEVLRHWGESGHIYECLYKSFVMEVTEVKGELADMWYIEDRFDRRTQKVYQITKNAPYMLAGYWIVSEIYHNGYTYYVAQYGGY